MFCRSTNSARTVLDGDLLGPGFSGTNAQNVHQSRKCIQSMKNSNVGRIIGKGGSRIRELQEVVHVFRFPVIPVASRCLSPFVAPLKLKKKPRPLIEAFLESDTRSGPGRGRCSFNNDVSRDVKPEGSPPRQSINWLELFEKSEEMSLLR